MKATEQVEKHVDDRSHDEWLRAAYIAATALTIASGGKKQYKASDLVEHPAKAREKEKKKKQLELDNDALRKIALDKGLNPNF